MGSASVSGGQLVLDGTSGNYVDLGSHILDTIGSDVTVEVWSTWNGTGPIWQNIYSFGSNTGGRSAQGTGVTYFNLMPGNGSSGTTRFCYTTTNSGGWEYPTLNWTQGLAIGTESLVTVVYSPTLNSSQMYINGALVATGVAVNPLSALDDVNDYVGHSQWSDPEFNGTISELRIYNGVLSPAQVLADYKAGADDLTGTPGTLQTLTVNMASIALKGATVTPPVVTAKYANLTDPITLTGLPGIVLTSGDSSVITIQGDIIRAVGYGTTTVTATYGGKSGFATITVPNLSGPLIHRYSFTTDATDSIGGKDATLLGSAYVDSGSLMLDGSTGCYADLGGGIISNMTADVTVEVWATWNGTAPTWQNLFAFGSNSGGRGSQGTGQTYFSLMPGNGSSGLVRFVVTTNSNGAEIPNLNGPSSMPIGTEANVTIVYSPTANQSRMYVDGQLVASGTAPKPLSSLNDYNDYIGRSQWGDPFYSGSINEFRIYNTALTAAQIEADFEAGANNASATPGNVQFITLSIDRVGLLGGIIPAPTVTAKYSGISATINISGDTNITFTSSDTTIVSIDTNGVFHAVGTGTAMITAAFQGKTSAAPVIVQLETVKLMHRYSFNEAATSTTSADSVGGANAELVGAVLDGAGHVTMDGTGGYVNLPNGIISALTNATFETWVTWAGGANWQRIFDFGNTTQGEDQSGTGQTYIYLTPKSYNGPIQMGITTGSEQDVAGISPLAIGKEVNVTVVYNASQQWAKLYEDGKFVSSNTVTLLLRDIKDVNNWLGRSQWNDPYLNASINEFRIYEGVKSDLDISVDAASGPNTVVSDAGGLQSIALSVTNTTVDVHGFGTPVSVLATYANIANVDVATSPDTTFTLSDPTLATIKNGILTPLNSGTLTIGASYLGKSGSIVLSLVDTNGPLALLDRYSFNEAAGSTTVKDSVGGKDGTLVGVGTFTGTQLVVPGGASSTSANPAAGYVDLPNGMISGLPSKVTFEMWATWNGGGSWQPMFSFGSSTGGEDVSGTGQTYLVLVPSSGSSTLRVAFTINSNGSEAPLLNGAPLATGVESYVVLTYDSDLGVARLFRNGVRVDTQVVLNPLSSLDDVNNWLGRPQWGDPYFNGSYNEFRIWNGIMTDKQVADSMSSGADYLPGTNPKPPITVSVANGQVTLSWPATGTGFILESTPVLGKAATWTQVHEADGKLTVTLPASQSTLFYRLRK